MHSRLLTVALLCSLLSVATAQQPDPGFAFAIEDAYGVGWVDGELRAASHSYAACFEAGSVEVTPRLGMTARRDYPMRVSLQSIHRGPQEVLLTAPGSVVLGNVAPDLVGESVLYRYGEGIAERYDVRADGVKQSVVFAERPAGVGDLVVRYSVVTDLECAPARQADELHFRAGDLGGIVIGTVIGIDARGRRVQGQMAFDGEQLELVLPHDFVETATYPLELDPLFGVELNSGSSFSDTRADIAYDAASNIYCVVFEFPGSQVHVQRHDALTGVRLGGGVVAGGAGSQSRPQVASINQSDRFLVVWEDTASGSSDIKCRAIRASDGAMSQSVTIAATFADELAPDVGGDAFDSLDIEALVVWQEVGVGIRGVQVTVAATGDPVLAGGVVTLDPLPLSANPTISKSGGMDPSNGGRYVVAWEANLGGAPLIGFVGVDRDLNLLTAPSYTAGGVEPANPDVDGDGTQFLLVFQALEGPAPAKSDIWGQPLEFCTGGTTLCAPVPSALANTAGNDELDPATAFLGPMFAVAWEEAISGTLSDSQIAVTNVVPGTSQLCGSLSHTGPSTLFHNQRPAICAKRSGGAGSDDALISWEKLENSSGNSTLKSFRYHAFTGGPVTQIAGVGGCGTGGTAGVNGPFAIGNAEFALTLRNADPTAPLAWLFFDTAMGAVVSCGSCIFIDPLIVSPAFPVINGDVDVPLPMPCASVFLGFSMDVQWLVFTPVAAAQPCPLFPFLSGSNAIRMVLAN